ncbi:hypothetical protein PPROV_000634500 [Pycnococcus provasolii]|uniref:Uncharacterized protein n=1 Tax=Pycnococcus provasolii TaxID=41880 RepID=A0A830HLR9_9CHLO|nr:hypothetical protein PPROV_000634500 [Pycnococcus provasolii]
MERWNSWCHSGLDWPPASDHARMMLDETWKVATAAASLRCLAGLATALAGPLKMLRRVHPKHHGNLRLGAPPDALGTFPSAHPCEQPKPKVFCVDPGSCKTGNNHNGFSDAKHGCVSSVALALGKSFPNEPQIKFHDDSDDSPEWLKKASATDTTPEPPATAVDTWRAVWCGQNIKPNVLYSNNLLELFV